MSADPLVRGATPQDIPAIFALIQSLAKYERLVVDGSEAQLAEHLFGDRPYAEAIVAETDAKVVGFALFFHNYSTFLTQPGIYLEDLFVQPDYRGRGIGKALIRQVAQIARDRDCGRLEWSVLDWNESAIAFYRGLGAAVLPDWRICRVTDESLHDLAESAISRSVM
jgi:GNAT superfamily N-acetyltransferase